MKKTILLLCFVMMAFGSAMSQDTIHIRDMRQMPGYYVPVWPENFQYIAWEQLFRGHVLCYAENFEQMKEEAFKMYTDDTLLVYGIAACLAKRDCLFTEDFLFPGEERDTVCENLYDYLRLYEADPDSLRHIGEELLVHLNYTPVSYYIDLDLIRGWQGDAANPELIMQPVLPMYERYFSAPVTVADSFYVGRRYRPTHHDGRQIGMLSLADSCYYGREYFAFYCDFDQLMSLGDSVWTWSVHGWKYHSQSRQAIRFLFPILTPPDSTCHPVDTIVTGGIIVHPGNTLVINTGDTIVISGDTLVNTGGTVTVLLGDTLVIGGHTLVLDAGDTLFVNPGDTLFVGPDGSIHVNPGGTFVLGSGGGTPGGDPGDDPGVGLRQTDMVSRYTSVAPNPATERATVLSSFGLERIEVYDSQGRLLHTLPATGYRAVLDTHAWPSGTYLLRITTPLGPTTKKLLVQ